MNASPAPPDASQEGRAKMHAVARDRSGGRMRLTACILLTCAALACIGPAPSGSPPSAPAAPAAESSTKPKRITAAVRAELPTVSKTLNTIIPGATALDRLVSAGLTAVDDKGVLHPQLAEA